MATNTGNPLNLNKNTSGDTVANALLTGQNANMDKINTHIERIDAAMGDLRSTQFAQKTYSVAAGASLYLDHDPTGFHWLILGRGTSGLAYIVAFATGYSIGTIQRTNVQNVMAGSSVELTVPADRASVWLKNGSGTQMEVTVIAMVGNSPTN